MQTERSYWAGWAQFLHRWKLEHAACFVLDAAGPLSVLLAQMVYLGQPLFSGANSQQKWISLAQLLENPEESRSFAALLRQEEPL